MYKSEKFGFWFGDYYINVNDDQSLDYIKLSCKYLDPDYDLQKLIDYLLINDYYIGISPDNVINISKDWCLVW